MGICATKDTRADQNTNQINKQLYIDRVRANLVFKILCLGAGESGKSTILKQLKNIYAKKQMSEEEKTEIRVILHKNTKESMKQIIMICKSLNLDVSDVTEEVQLISESLIDTPMTKEEGDAIEKLWAHSSALKAFEERTRFYVPDSAPYYFENVQNLVDPTYEITEDDVIMARIRTTGIIVSEINIPPLKYNVVDVGGQKSERKKWISTFDNVNAIFFVVNLSGYITVLYEDDSKNRLHESLELFEEIVTNNFFIETPIFIFFNKKDLFEKYLKKKSLKYCFPEYNGPETTLDQMEYVKKKFEEKMLGNKKLAGYYFVAARFKKDIKYAFDEAKEIISKKYEKQISKALEDLK